MWRYVDFESPIGGEEEEEEEEVEEEEEWLELIEGHLDALLVDVSSVPFLHCVHSFAISHEWRIFVLLFQSEEEVKRRRRRMEKMTGSADIPSQLLEWDYSEILKRFFGIL